MDNFNENNGYIDHTHICLLRALYYSDLFTKEEKKNIKHCCKSRKPLVETLVKKYARYGETCSDTCPYFKTIQFYDDKIEIL